jgi:hypothetical protein
VIEPVIKNLQQVESLLEIGRVVEEKLKRKYLNKADGGTIQSEKLTRQDQNPSRQVKSTAASSTTCLVTADAQRSRDQRRYQRLIGSTNSHRHSVTGNKSGQC